MVWRYACGLDIVLRCFLVTFFHKFNLAIFQAFLQSKWIDSGYLVCATPPTVLCRFFVGNFTDVFCHGLKICMWFGYSPQIICCHFFPEAWNHFFSIFTIKVNMDSRYLVCATPPTVFADSFEIIDVFCHGPCGFDIVPIFFYHFHKLNLVIFSAFFLSYLVCATPPQRYADSW